MPPSHAPGAEAPRVSETHGVTPLAPRSRRKLRYSRLGRSDAHLVVHVAYGASRRHLPHACCPRLPALRVDRPTAAVLNRNRNSSSDRRCIGCRDGACAATISRRISPHHGGQSRGWYRVTPSIFSATPCVSLGCSLPPEISSPAVEASVLNASEWKMSLPRVEPDHGKRRAHRGHTFVLPFP